MRVSKKSDCVHNQKNKMAKFNQFSSENILMSVCGHLLLIAVLVTAAKVVVERAKLVTPDRIEIIEIDLDNVRVSGKETKLYNVGAPEKEQKQETKPVQKKKQEQAVEKVEIKSTTMVEEEVKEDKKEEDTTDKKTPEQPKDAPKKFCAIRSILSLVLVLTVPFSGSASDSPPEFAGIIPSNIFIPSNIGSIFCNSSGISPFSIICIVSSS